MARTKKRLKIIIIGHRDLLSYLIVSWLLSAMVVVSSSQIEWNKLVFSAKFDLEAV